MKNTKFTKLAVVLVAFALIGALIGITAGAEESEYTLSIESANVAYNETLQTAFTLTGTYPNGAKIGIATWAEGVEATAENATYIYTSTTQGKTTYYKTAGVAAAEMDTIIQVAACYNVGGVNTIAEEPFEYSIVKYAGKRLAADQINTTQAELYSSLIEYATSSNTLFADAETFACVKAVGGYVGLFDVAFGGWAGYDVVLRADATNANGEYFIGWYDADGNEISKNRMTTVASPEAGVDTYTAKFGAAEDSLYKNTYGFESLTTGAVDFTNVNYFSKPNEPSYNDKICDKVWKEKRTLENVTFTNPIVPVVDANKKAYRDPVTGSYTPDYRNDMRVTESLSGDKELYVGFKVSVTGYSVSVTNSNATKDESAVELDLIYHNSNQNNGIGQFANITLKNADGSKEVAFRMNLQKIKNMFNISDEPPKNETTNRQERVSTEGSVYVADGASTLLRFEFDYENLLIKCYANGTHLGDLDMTKWSSYITASEKPNADWYIASVSVGTPSGTMNDISIDNVNFTK